MTKSNLADLIVLRDVRLWADVLEQDVTGVAVEATWLATEWRQSHDAVHVLQHQSLVKVAHHDAATPVEVREQVLAPLVRREARSAGAALLHAATPTPRRRGRNG